MVGMYPGYWYVRNNHITQIKNSIHNGQLKEVYQTIVLSAQDFNMLDVQNENEFVWKGSMYDVVSYRLNDDGQYEVICFSDLTDDVLHHCLKQINSSNTNEHGTGTQLKYQLTDVFTMPDEHELPPISNILVSHYIQQAVACISPIASIPSPPPKF
jgi:hypothetical protein